MMLRRLSPLLWSVVFAAAGSPAFAADPPKTRTVDVVDELHGERVADPYRWLEDPTNPEVQTWFDAQNHYLESYLVRFEATRKAVLSELERLYADSSTQSIPDIHRDRYFYARRDGLQNHAVRYVRIGDWSAPEQLVIDPNKLSEDGTVALDWLHPSPDGMLVAYGTSPKGSEKSTLKVRRVDTGEDMDFSIPNTRACSVAWRSDNAGFFYTRYPAAGSVPEGDENYHRTVYYHAIGGDTENDPVIFQGKQKEEWPGVTLSSDEKYVILSTSVDWVRNDLYLRPANVEERLQPLAVGLDAQFGADVIGDTVYIRTNLDAPRYRLMKTDLAHLDVKQWKEIIPQGEGVLENAQVVGGKIVALVTKDVQSHLYVYSTDGSLIREIELPGIGTVGGISGRYDRDDLFFSFESFTHPPANYRYNVATGEMTRYWQEPTDVESSRYVTQQVWFKSKDGTRVPMYVVHRRGIRRDHSNPTLLYGYGGFDISLMPRFDKTIFPWLERGGVYAVANLRGGGEFGRTWHEAGRMERKQNVFDDFIAAAQSLIDYKYTRPEKLAIRGGSNGGLLVGAVLTQRPELFRAVLCQVPLLDMLRYHHFRVARLWIPEYGSAEDPEQFRFLRAYSPYHRVKDKEKYPAVLLTTGLEDSRVDPMHAWKMAARLQAATASAHPIFVYTESKAGHGAGKPLNMQLQERADQMVFLMAELGMVQPDQPASTPTP